MNGEFKVLDWLYNLDCQLLLFFNNHRIPFLNPVMILFSASADNGLIWIGITLILLCLPKYRTVGIVTALALLLNLILCNIILKNLLQRTRPFETEILETLSIIIPKPTDFSFPSGHTMASFAAAWVMAAFVKKWARLAIGLAVMIGFSRIYLCVHYPSDVLGGMILGILCGMATVTAYRRWLYRYCPPLQQLTKV